MKRYSLIEQCILQGAAEVIPVSIFEYNEEETLKAIKADEYELGVQYGITQ